MKLTFKLSILFFIIMAQLPAFAGQMLGGQISWTCQPNGSFKFEVVRYANCSDALIPNPDTVVLQSPLGAIKCVKTDSIFISPTCYSSAYSITCDTNQFYTPTYKYVYTSAPVFLSGTVPSLGWVFYYNETNRPKTTNTVSTNNGYMLRTIMYPPNKNAQNVFEGICRDNAPVFGEKPLNAFATTSQDLYVEATEKDIADSLFYDWAEPWNNSSVYPSTAIAYDTAYSFTQPLPANNLSVQNEAPILYPSGRLTFKSVTTGTFATCVKMSSFKNGVLVSEVFRDLQFDINADPGLPGACSGTANQKPTLNLSAIGGKSVPAAIYQTGKLLHYQINALPGDTIWFGIAAADYDLEPSCLAQEIQAYGLGFNFSQSQIGNTDCGTAPCARFISQNAGGSLVASSQNNMQFFWVVDTAHIPAASGSGSYTFDLNFADNHCILPAVAQMRLVVKVNRPIYSEKNTTTICQGDSTTTTITGQTSNLSWSPTTNISCTTCANPVFYPSVTTLYTATDATSGYSINYQVIVNPTPPALQLSQNGNNLVLGNAASFDSIVWHRNFAPFHAVGNTYTPTLSGTYWATGYKGVCTVQSANFTYDFNNNMAFTLGTTGAAGASQNASKTYGTFVRFQNEDFYAASGFYLHATDKNAQGANLSALYCRVYDSQQGSVFSSDSVTRVSEDLLLFHGDVNLNTREDYLISFYVDTSVVVPLYVPATFPVATTQSRILVYNATTGAGTNIPTNGATSYPFYHIALKWGIGLFEFDVLAPKIFPNPAQSRLNVLLPGLFEIQLYTTTGTLVHKSTAQNQTNIDVSSYNSGIYILQIHQNGQTYRSKIVRN